MIKNLFFTGLNMFSSFLSTPVPSAGDRKSTATASGDAPSITPPTETIDARLSAQFTILMQNEEFKQLWEEVNANLHKPIKLIPSSTEKQAAIHPTKCSKKGSDQLAPICLSKPTGSIHGFNIYVNAGSHRTNSEIKYSIIFETCNAKFWPLHSQITKLARQSLVADADRLTTLREEVEWKVLRFAKTAADTIDPEISDFHPSLLLYLDDFQKYLNDQKRSGHYAYAKKEILKFIPPSPAKSSSFSA